MRDRFSSLSRYLPMALILGAGMGMSVAAATWVGRWELITRQTQFQQEITNLTTAIQRSINRYNELLMAIGDLYAASNNQVTHDEFAQFVHRALMSYPGIQALEWAPYLSQTERSQYEQMLQRQYPFHRLGITEADEPDQMIRAGDRPFYVPVTFVEPLPGNEIAVGFDLASDRTRRVALERSRNTGKIAATGRIKLVQETSKDQYSFLVFLPIYEQAANTPAARRQFLMGYVLGVFRVADVVEESLQDLNYDIDFYLYDQTAADDQQFLGFYDSTSQQLVTLANQNIQNRLGQGTLCPAGKDCMQTLSFGQREWRILFLPSSTYIERTISWGAAATFSIGVLITGSLMLYLSRSQAELERTRELSDLKLRLFSMTSHELRTPLSVILVSAQSLETNQNLLSPEQKVNAIQRIQTSARRMSQLLSDILLLTRAEAGKLEFAPEILNLPSFCCQLVEDIQASMEAHQSIHFICQEPCPPGYLDPKLLRSIVINLLSNAVKYSPPGVKINVALSWDADQFYFQVSDQGIGISPTAQAHLFEAFYRGENVGDIPGTGLGLAVVKTCVDLQGGRVDVKSAIAQGTTITVILPRIH